MTTEIGHIGVLPQLGFGTWQRRGADCIRTVRCAIDVGYPAIDTAAMYENEVEVGQAIRDSGKRDDIFLSTKVWFSSLGAGEVRQSLEASLQRLGLEHVDLTLIHWPSPDGAPMDRYLTELAEAQEAGLTRHIGVSNFTKAHMDEAVRILGADRIASNQVELNVFFRNRPIAEHCKALGIPVTAYLPLSQGRIGDKTGLDSVAERHGATSAQIALAWLLQNGYVAIPSSSNDDRIAENFAAKDIVLTPEDLAELDALEDGVRRVSPDFGPQWDAA